MQFIPTFISLHDESVTGECLIFPNPQIIENWKGYLSGNAIFSFLISSLDKRKRAKDTNLYKILFFSLFI